MKALLVSLSTPLVLLAAPLAHADIPADYAEHHSVTICQVMDRYPSLSGALAAIRVAEYEGLNPWQADRAVRLAVRLVCPEHNGILNKMLMT